MTDRDLVFLAKAVRARGKVVQTATVTKAEVNPPLDPVLFAPPG